VYFLSINEYPNSLLLMAYQFFFVRINGKIGELSIRAARQIHIYIFIYMYIHINICIYIHIYIYKYASN
jgi:uncharacterized membrane protein AbrB (regulator of aidB expression)